MVPEEGIEPSHLLQYTILSRARLPIPPLRHTVHTTPPLSEYTVIKFSIKTNTPSHIH